MLLRSQRAVLRVGTHNIMDGIWLPSLLAQYRQQQRGPNPLHVLCVQEAVPNAASAVAAALTVNKGIWRSDHCADTVITALTR